MTPDGLERAMRAVKQRLKPGPVPLLPAELRDLLDAVAARVPLDDLIDEYAVRVHGSRPGPPTETDLARARVHVVRLLGQLRAAL